MRNRKNLPKTAIPRIYFIDHEISSNTFPNAGQLAAKYETSLSTINRDIAYMRDMLGAPIEYDAQRRGFYYSKKTFRLSAGFAGAEELLALGITKNVLTLCEHTPVYDAANRVLEEISLPLKGEMQYFEKRIVVPPVAFVKVPDNIWKIVIQSLRENKVLAISYRAVSSPGPEIVNVHPYQLLFDFGAWYLYAFGEYCSAPRIYSVSRMLSAEITGREFSLPEHFEYLDKTGGSFFGVFSGDTFYHFSVEFFGDSITWIGERQWAQDQTVKVTDTSIIISFTSTQYGKILGWVLSQGSNARPLKPARLVKEWKDNVFEMNHIANSILPSKSTPKKRL